MIPADELACIQASFAETLDKVATIKRNPNLGHPVNGTVPDEWNDVATDVPCSQSLVQSGGGQVSGYLQAWATLLASQQGWVLKFKTTQDVQPKDQVVIDGLTYQVHAYLGPRSLEVFRRMLVTKVA